MEKYNVAVVGVGAVGEEMLRILAQRNFPIGELRVFARSAREISVDDKTYSVEQINNDGFKDINIALFAGTEGEKGAAVTFAPEAKKRGAIVIDNGADFRMEPDVPLVVPEVNPEDVKKHNGIISNPNCSTIQMVVALNPIYKVAGLKRVIVSSYQAVSGAGRSAVKQLEGEVNIDIDFSSPAVSNFSSKLVRPFAFNVIPQIGGFSDSDFTSEEWKMVHETQKIMHDENIKISATTVRVPVKTGHSEAIYIETAKQMPIVEIKKVFSDSPGIKLVDDVVNNVYPMPIDCEGKDEVFIGRIRKDPYVETGLWVWVVSDNLRKGAALNAIQIAEEVVKQELL